MKKTFEQKKKENQTAFREAERTLKQLRKESRNEVYHGKNDNLVQFRVPEKEIELAEG